MPRLKDMDKDGRRLSVADVEKATDADIRKGELPPDLAYEAKLRENTLREIAQRRIARLISMFVGMMFAIFAMFWGISLHPIILERLKQNGTPIDFELGLWQVSPLIAFTAAATFLLISAHRKIEVTGPMKSGVKIADRLSEDDVL